MADSICSNEKVGDEVPGKQKFAVSREKLCQPCCNAAKRTVAEECCLDCSEYLCSACSKTHLQFNISRNHKIVAAGDADKQNVSYEMKGLDRCKEHNKLFEFICEDHNMLCCSACAVAKHRKCHNVVEIENKAKTNATDLTSLRRDLLDIESKAKAYAKRFMNIRANVASDAINIISKIQKMQDKVNEMFENLKRNVAKEIDPLQQHLDKKNDVCISDTTQVTEALSDVDNVRQQGTRAQQLIMAHHLKDRVKSLKAKIDNDISDLKDIHMSFDFDQSIQLLLTNNATPGKLKINYMSVDAITFIDSINSQHKDQKVKLTLLASVGQKER
jgi:hypothetical protein